MAANDYRVYLRNHIDMDEAPARVAHTGSTHRALIFITLAIMGLLQVASSVAILLHLTGYLREVDLVKAQQTPNEEMHSETLIADPLRSTKEKKDRCRKKDARLPLAHLPISTTNDFSTSVHQNKEMYTDFEQLEEDPIANTIIHWNEGQGTLKKIKYHDGRILVDEPGYYYVYAKTCFRYAKEHDTEKVDLSNIQLLQYIYHEKHTQNIISPIMLGKSGGTHRQWNIAKYNMFCAVQGRGVQLNKGDGLYVSVSYFWLLDPAADGTYFGAFKISD
ncbi:tumor necrosis factor ligand superfamily member 11 isoform X1 [Triplophysa dalaica]|uniref:tumor necrosis factor ligand superfamily member 11 isoform X1 n=1 Tax=Triplophysa dalaica TaxID=1582913 RepID=UPI0024DF9B70|nr:tumor necrosis factor ligand superfamily member 11 isoform X1 [Triplophysa dalaica]